jgi:hypothetical protein
MAVPAGAARVVCERLLKAGSLGPSCRMLSAGNFYQCRCSCLDGSREGATALSLVLSRTHEKLLLLLSDEPAGATLVCAKVGKPKRPVARCCSRLVAASTSVGAAACHCLVTGVRCFAHEMLLPLLFDACCFACRWQLQQLAAVRAAAGPACQLQQQRQPSWRGHATARQPLPAAHSPTQCRQHCGRCRWAGDLAPTNEGCGVPWAVPTAAVESDSCIAFDSSCTHICVLLSWRCECSHSCMCCCWCYCCCVALQSCFASLHTYCCAVCGCCRANFTAGVARLLHDACVSA